MKTEHHFSAGVRSSAMFSDDMRYRYALRRIWDDVGTQVAFLMLNPSTADAFKNDPTVERCMRRAQAWGHGGFHVVNLFAYRSTDPREMLAQADPVGPDNDCAIASVCSGMRMVVCAWGGRGNHRNRAAEVLARLRGQRLPLFALKVSPKGVPHHPLYLPYELHPMPFPTKEPR